MREGKSVGYSKQIKEIAVYKDNNVGYVTINRPEKMNALNSKILKELYFVFEQLEEDDNVKVIVLQGGGEKAFIGGADIEEFDSLEDPLRFRSYYLLFVKLATKIMELSKPVIAAVRGYAFGGGCLIALACDMVIATTSSKFGQQEINFGFMGSAGLLPKLIGKHKAAEIIMLGEPFSANEGYRLGLVNKVVAEEELEITVEEICKKLIAKSPYALKLIKTSIRVALEAGPSVSNLYESEVSSLCFTTLECRGAIKEFLKKSRQ